MAIKMCHLMSDSIAKNSLIQYVVNFICILAVLCLHLSEKTVVNFKGPSDSAKEYILLI